MHSALYRGEVRHRRSSPRMHAFSYTVTLCYLDLAELDELLSAHRWWSTRRGFPVQVRRSDYLGDPEVPLHLAARRAVEAALGSDPGGPVRLLAQVRTFGWCFNPLSLYYCFDRSGQAPVAVVAEVTNTPWGERHAYVLGAQDDGTVDCSFDKAMHVSPFMAMDQRYRFILSAPGERLGAAVSVLEGSRSVLEASLSLERSPLDHQAMSELIWKDPLGSLRVSAEIYLQAARLWAKGVPFHPHPARRTA